jgi:hypothetical protein
MNHGIEGDVVIISCVTFETVKIVEPAKERGASRVHLIHYIRDPEDCKYSIYWKFYKEVCDRLSDSGIDVIEHDAKVYDYHSMLRKVMGIMKEEAGNRIMVNISAGTAEYAAAAMLASTMNPGTVPFTVGTREYTIPQDTLEDLYFENGRPLGLSKAVYPSKDVVTFSIEAPDWELLLALGVLDRINAARQPSSASFAISKLKETGVWDYCPQSERGRSTVKQKEAMYYKRHFIDPMTENGWLVKERSRFILTDNGRTILDAFSPGME